MKYSTLNTILIQQELLLKRRRNLLAVEAFKQGYKVHRSKKDYNRQLIKKETQDDL